MVKEIEMEKEIYKHKFYYLKDGLLVIKVNLYKHIINLMKHLNYCMRKNMIKKQSYILMNN